MNNWSFALDHKSIRDRVLTYMNLLPLPPLDGGRILFCVLEKIYRPVVRVEPPVTLAGWTVVLVLMVYATVQDVGRILA
jgi:regulator of sigma E protease